MLKCFRTSQHQPNSINYPWGYVWYVWKVLNDLKFETPWRSMARYIFMTLGHKHGYEVCHAISHCLFCIYVPTVYIKCRPIIIIFTYWSVKQQLEISKLKSVMKLDFKAAVLGPVLLTFLRHVARISANGIAAFKESCAPIGQNSCDMSQ